ncbi:MAG TPA: F0F1 ATP synthase subunit A [Thermomicrobiales bacterium]|nr:F0F1 ATP synthase subunit A [Thermomicrobiales bacterium]
MDDLHVSIEAESLFEIGLGPLGTFNFTNSFLMMLVVMAFLIIGGAIIARGATVIPSRGQSIFEMVAEFLLGLVEATAGKRVGRRIFPLIGALFIFIIVANYSGLLPGVGTIYWEREHQPDAAALVVASISQPGSDIVVAPQAEEEEAHHVPPPILRAPNADLNMTLAMALITFTVVQFAGVATFGVWGRIKHMGDPWFMFPIELISEISRIVSLSFRLFGNIFAGEVLIALMVTMSTALLKKTYFLVFPLFALPTAFLFLEVLFGFIQALVFALLTLIYIALATAGHDDHGQTLDGNHEVAHDDTVPRAAPSGASH